MNKQLHGTRIKSSNPQLSDQTVQLAAPNSCTGLVKRSTYSDLCFNYSVESERSELFPKEREIISEEL